MGEMNMGNQYISGIDIGTTGVKVIIFDAEGNKISSAYREYPCTFPQSGWVEQDGEMTWAMTCEASKEAIVKSGLDPEEILAIGLSSQRCTSRQWIKTGWRCVPLLPGRTAARSRSAKKLQRRSVPNGITKSPACQTVLSGRQAKSCGSRKTSPKFTRRHTNSHRTRAYSP